MMEWRTMGRVAVIVFAFVAPGVTACSPAMSEEPKVPSLRSAPPDVTPYARPAIPEDSTPCGKDVNVPNVPCPNPAEATPPIPQLRPSQEMPPRPSEGVAPQPGAR